LKQRLMIIPADRYGVQRLLDHQLAAHPRPLAIREIADPFGNRVLELDVPVVELVASFDVQMTVESTLLNLQKPTTSLAEAQHFLEFTPLTTPDERIRRVAHHLQADANSAQALAQAVNRWVYENMRYASGKTSVATTAAEALALGAGLCQDFAHIMLAICRTAGLPARYVSGHLLGEGGSHAWVEVFLPEGGGLLCYAFDPTHKRQPHLGYVTVAIGRDYQDVAPTSGSFTAPYGGQLSCHKRAGLTYVEYRSGETLQAHLS
jgi:transglutaminase-like putative cysteine protease